MAKRKPKSLSVAQKGKKQLKPKSPAKTTKNAKQSKGSETNSKQIPAKVTAKAKRKSNKKPMREDPKKPKKPPTAFFYFLEDFRKGYQEQNPNVKSMRDIGKACGEKWKTMTFEEKVQYYDIATVKRAEFEEATAAYIKRKESAEDSEESDEYE